MSNSLPRSRKLWMSFLGLTILTPIFGCSLTAPFVSLGDYSLHFNYEPSCLLTVTSKPLPGPYTKPNSLACQDPVMIETRR